MRKFELANGSSIEFGPSSEEFEADSNILLFNDTDDETPDEIEPDSDDEAFEEDDDASDDDDDDDLLGDDTEDEPAEEELVS